MENDLKAVFTAKNLTLAWQRIKSNPDSIYKGYFRPIYNAYAAAELEYLKSLAKRIKQNNFIPTIPTKIYIPKPSGILRPITLLSIEDQIVYQAFGNRIALKLNSKMKRMHYIKVFGNIFAGANSKWFYKKWTIAYNRYNFALRESFQDGYSYAADFDLTACYDSIDHSVLKHFLINLGFSVEFCNMFLEYLCYWTCVDVDKGTERIFHGHGIPQGPLTSGLISDIVLHVFDINKRIPKEVKYFRYVDDIKLLARNELSLRKALIVLDYTSKMVGLFPHMSVFSNIATVPELLGWEKARIQARIQDLLLLVGLDPEQYCPKYPHQLSGGEAQRVGVARALAADPAILLMDEPFGAVDPLNRIRLQTQFLEIQKKLNKTIILVTHDLDEAIRLGDKIAIMQEGALVQYDRPERVLAKPANQFVYDFVGSDRGLKRLSKINISPYVQKAYTIALAAAKEDAFAMCKKHRWVWVVDAFDTLQGWVDSKVLSQSSSVEQAVSGINPSQIAVSRQSSLREALSIMLSQGIKKVPVVDGKRRIVGEIGMHVIENILVENNQ